MPAIVDCPSCNRKLRVPDELLGRNVKCPTCSTTFQASAAAAPTAVATSVPPAATPQAVSIPPPANPQAAPDAPPIPHKRCPYCGENVVADAQRCQHCGEALAGEDRPWEQYGTGVRRDCEPHRGGLILTLGIISICCSLFTVLCYCGIPFTAIGLGLGIPAIVMGRKDLPRMAEGTMDPQGQGLTQAGWICGIVGTCLCALGLLIGVGFLVFMIVVQFA